MSFLYAIQMGADGPVKIGYSNEPSERLRTLQTGNPFDLRLIMSKEFPDGAWMEMVWHEVFAAVRLRGEWFSPHPQLMWAIEGMNQGAAFDMEPI